ncbi:hypothetical protein [Streptomyces sp. SPB074]|uniref:hypothetical protein n=1 Tax=Streptomyces sp. (strain SPB074) TaxID=465543 RepID=UPI00017F1BBB|nr:hypothetical protein [Streptomyces sp. SPB074]EDY46901.1 conserved hypothetical protein [Streptomyces sp. SPB074]
MTTRRTRTTAAALGMLCAGALALTACGGPGDADEAFKGQKADDIAAKAVAATDKAPSVHLKGTSHLKGGNVVKVDIRVDDKGHCTGTMSGDGAEAELLRDGGDILIKGDEKFWTNSAKASGGSGDQGAQLADKLAGKWVKAPADSADASLCDKKAFLASMDQDKSERRGLERGDTGEVAGKDALALKKKGGKNLTMHVATEGEPYLLRTETKGSQPNDMTFSEYGKKVEVHQPADDEIVDPAHMTA